MAGLDEGKLTDLDEGKITDVDEGLLNVFDERNQSDMKENLQA